MASSISLFDASAFSPGLKFNPAARFNLGSMDCMSFRKSAERAWGFMFGPGIPIAAICSMLGAPRPPNGVAPIDARGFGVGRRPPPGIIPATALAGANSDIALDSSGMTPSAKGTTIKALSTKTVFVRCWETPTDSASRNFTKQTREVTGKGESSGGNSLSSSMVPRNPNRVLICSDVVLGETFVTWITCVLEFIFASAIVELAIC